MEEKRKPGRHDVKRVLDAFEKAYAGAKDGDKLDLQFGRSGRIFILECAERPLTVAECEREQQQT